MPTLEGHRRGYDKIKQAGQWCLDRNVKYLTVYAFSTENWNRSKEEVGYLMKLLKDALTNDVDYFHELGIQIRISGIKEQLNAELQEAIILAEKKTKDNQKGVLNICLNYGGRPEILSAVKKIVASGLGADEITEQLIQDNLWTAGIPDPDLIVRTSGEQRLSNFLTWQSSYAELMFIPENWPDFSEEILDHIINDFNSRSRRFGGN